MSTILFLSTSQYPTNAGAARNIFNLAINLQKRNFQCKVISFNYNSFRFVKNTIEGVKQFVLPYIFKAKYFKRLNKLYIIPIVINEVLKAKNIIIVSKPIGYKTAIVLGWILRKAVIMRSSSFGLDDMTSLIKQYGHSLSPINKFIFSKITCYISINKAFTQSYQHIFPNNSNFVEHVQGVDTSIFKPTESNISQNKIELYGKDTFIFLSVSNVLKRKGIYDNILALKDLQQDFLYVIVGDHSIDKNDSFHKLWKKDRVLEMKEIYDLGKELLGERIQFLARKESVVKYYQSSDVLLHTSYVEGFPNVVLEAFACGLPVIVRNINGVYDNLMENGKTGFVINNQEELSAKIKYVLSLKENLHTMAIRCTDLIKIKGSFQSLTNELIKWLKH